MKNRKWTVTLSCVALALVTLLSSCAGNGSKSVEQMHTEQSVVESTEAPLKEPTYIIKDGVCDYTVVYEHGAEGAKSAAMRLAQHFQTKFKLSIETKSSDEVTYDPSTKEILIGNTGFSESKAAADALVAVKACTFTENGNKLVMVAGSDSMLSEKMLHYVEKILPDGVSFSQSTGKATVKFIEYIDNEKSNAKVISVNGVDISEFSIVYENDADGSYKEIAEDLSASVSDACGVKLSTVSDGAAEAKHEILIGATNRSESASFAQTHGCEMLEYNMGVVGDKYVIVGGGPLPVRIGVQRFINTYVLSISNEVDVPAGKVISKEYYSGPVVHSVKSDMRIMTLNMMAEYYAIKAYGGNVLSPQYRFEALEAILAAYSPDVIGMQECSPLWREIMATRLDRNVWDIIDPGRSDGSNGETIIVYNKQRLTLKDSGVIAYPASKDTTRMVYGHFALKSNTECEFVLLNSHWSWSDSQVADEQMRTMAQKAKELMSSKGDIPVFCTGDFNTKWNSERYQAFCQNSGLVDSFNTAKTSGNTVNEIAGYGNPGDESRKNNLYQNVVDHIFCPSYVSVHRYETVIDNRYVDLSDHAPRYADVSWTN